MEIRHVYVEISDNQKIIVNWTEFYPEKREDMDAWDDKQMVYDIKEAAIVKINELFTTMIDEKIKENGNTD